MRPFLIEPVEQVASSVVLYMKEIEQRQRQPPKATLQQPSLTLPEIETIDENHPTTPTSTVVEEIHQEDNLQHQIQCIQKMSVCHDILDIAMRATIYIT